MKRSISWLLIPIKWVEINSVGVDIEIRRNAKHPCTKRYQNKDTGNYYYKDEDFSWDDSKESKIALTFESDSKDRKDQPMDPAWKAQNGSATRASNRVRKERPLNRKWHTVSDKGEISGNEVEEFTWSLNLTPVKNNK